MSLGLSTRSFATLGEVISYHRARLACFSRVRLLHNGKTESRDKSKTSGRGKNAFGKFISFLILIVSIPGVESQARSSSAADTDIGCAKAVAQVDLGNFEEGIRQLEELYKVDPKSRRLLNCLSYAHNREGARIDSNPAAALREFCLSLFYNGLNPKAQGNAKLMIRMMGKNPEDFSERIQIAEDAESRKDYVSAIVEYEAALKLHEDKDIRTKLESVTKLVGHRPSPIESIDFKSYMEEFSQRVKRFWKSPQLDCSEALVVRFDLNHAGAASDLLLVHASNYRNLNHSVLDAVANGAPYDPLPLTMPEHATINFTFNYKIRNAAEVGLQSASTQDAREQEEARLKCGLLECERLKLPPNDLINGLLKLGAHYLSFTQLSEAEPLLLRAQSLQNAAEPTPKYVDTLNDLAELNFKLEHFDKAEDLLKQSLKLTADHPELGLFKQNRALTLYADLLVRAKRPDEAKGFMARADAQIHQQKGTVEEYTQAISASPQDAVNYFLRGRLYMSQPDWQKAQADFDKVIALNPKYVYAYVLRANVDEHLKNDSQELSDLEKAKELDPKFELVFRTDAMLHSRFKQWDKAIKDYDRAIELDPKSAGAYRARGNAYMQLKDYQSALADIAQALQLSANDQDALLIRGSIYDALKQYQKALQAYNAAIALKPDYAHAYEHRGLTNIHVEDYTAAVQDLDKCISLDPSANAVVYLNRGFARGKLGEFERALPDFDEAIKREPKSIINWGDRSWAYYCTGNFQKAAKPDSSQSNLL